MFAQVVINCSIIPQMKYNKATPTFHQWRDGVRTVYGLNFSTPDEANHFAEAMENALQMLNDGGGEIVMNELSSGIKLLSVNLLISNALNLIQVTSLFSCWPSSHLV